MSKTIYHYHHIVPKHMGGTDKQSNLIKVTIKEHSKAHKKLWKKYGRKEDYLAWKALSGQIGKEEILYERSLLGASQPKEKNGMWGRTHSKEQKEKWSKKRKGVKLSSETKRKMSEAHKKRDSYYWTGKTLTKEMKNKISKKLKGRIMSNETKKRMSEAAKQRYKS